MSAVGRVAAATAAWESGLVHVCYPGGAQSGPSAPLVVSRPQHDGLLDTTSTPNHLPPDRPPWPFPSSVSANILCADDEINNEFSSSTVRDKKIEKTISLNPKTEYEQGPCATSPSLDSSGLSSIDSEESHARDNHHSDVTSSPIISSPDQNQNYAVEEIRFHESEFENQGLSLNNSAKQDLPHAQRGLASSVHSLGIEDLTVGDSFSTEEAISPHLDFGSDAAANSNICRDSTVQHHPVGRNHETTVDSALNASLSNNHHKNVSDSHDWAAVSQPAAFEGNSGNLVRDSSPRSPSPLQSTTSPGSKLPHEFSDIQLTKSHRSDRPEREFQNSQESSRRHRDEDVEALSPTNSSFDYSDRSEPTLRDDDYANPPDVDIPRSLATRKAARSGGTAGLDTPTSKGTRVSGILSILAEHSLSKSSMPVVAVLGADTFLGSHIVLELLRRQCRRVRAVVASSESSSFLACMPEAESLLEVVQVGDIGHRSAQIPLRGALRGVDEVVNAWDFTAPQDGRSISLARVADRAVQSARALSEALGAPGSSVTRLIHIGSDTSVFDPKNCDRERDGEIELDENCWFDVSDDRRKAHEAEPFGSTAAEMLLWAPAAGVSYSMCSVIPSLVLGPLLTPSHASSAGHALLVDYISRSYAIPPIPTPIVDCRDVAWCVGSLVTTHPHVCGRVLMMGQSLTSGELVSECRRLYPGFSWPVRALPKWAVSSHVGIPWRISRRAVKARYGRRYALSQRRAVAEVGVLFRDAFCTVRDSIDSLSEFSVVDLHARKSSRLGAGGRFSSRLSNIDLGAVRKTASGRV